MGLPTRNLIDMTDELVAKAHSLENSAKNGKWSECNQLACQMCGGLLSIGKYLLGFEPELGKSLILKVKELLTKMELDYEETLDKISRIDDSRGEVASEPTRRYRKE